MSQRQATKKRNAPQKKGTVRQNNSSNAGGKGPRKQDNARPRIGTSLNEGAGFRSGEPSIMTIGRKTTVSHKELTAVVNTGGAPNSGVFTQYLRLRINPGSQATFPWLCKMAALYESFRFKRLRFVFWTRCPATQTGSLIMAPDYDAADGQFGNYASVPQLASEATVFSNVESVDKPIYQKQIVLELSPARLNRLFKAHSCMSDSRFSTTKQDQKTVDPGQVFVYSDSPATAAFNYGKLTVEYEIEFFEPQGPTDPVTQGGFDVSVNTGLTVATPIIAGQPDSNQEANPIINFNPVNVTYPTSIIGQFNRAWEGELATRTGGAGLSGYPAYWTSSANVASIANDLLQNELTGFRSASSGSTTTLHKIVAQAGDYLKINSPALGTTSSFFLGGGGVSAQLL